ncbi:MAG: CidA/LrgA family protein [Anaerolineae bacterium]
MIGGLALLLLFQLAGEILVRLLELPVPGPVAGMILLFLALMAWGKAPDGLEAAAGGLLEHLALMFVPAGSGIVAYIALIRREWLPITVALIASTLIAIAVTALTMQYLVKRTSRATGEGS